MPRGYRALDNFICPVCHRKLDDDHAFNVSLEYNTIIYGNRALVVSPTQAEILYVLKRTYPEVLSKDKFYSQVWGAADVHVGTVRTQIHQVNKKLEAFGYRIRFIHPRGYRLEKTRQDQAPVYVD